MNRLLCLAKKKCKQLNPIFSVYGVCVCSQPTHSQQILSNRTRNDTMKTTLINRSCLFALFLKFLFLLRLHCVAFTSYSFHITFSTILDRQRVFECICSSISKTGYFSLSESTAPPSLVSPSLKLCVVLRNSKLMKINDPASKAINSIMEMEIMC